MRLIPFGLSECDSPLWSATRLHSLSVSLSHLTLSLSSCLSSLSTPIRRDLVWPLFRLSQGTPFPPPSPVPRPSSPSQSLSIGSSIKIIHKRNGFALPPLTTPVILLGIGTGIAPLRSIIQHRTALATQQNILNHYVKTILLYECNDPEEDFLYYDEICEANRNRSVTTCHVAFSQRNGAYRSIQDLLKNAKIKSMIGDSMDIEGARIYCSGNKDTVRVVEQSIVQLVMEKDGVTEAQAVELLQGADQIYSSKVFVPGS
jgi:hypothetical protein